MRKKVKTIIKEYRDDNIVCLDIPLITSLFEYSRGLSAEDITRIVKNIVSHGSEEYYLKMSDYDHIIAK